MLREFAFRLYAGPHTTKYVLEDQFNHLQHVAKQQNKGRMHMAKDTQWFYASTSSILKTANLPSPTVTFKTFQDCFKHAHTMKQKEQSASEVKQKVRNIFKPKSHTLPASFGEVADLLCLKRNWKAAGYNSNRTASAATMFILNGKANSWNNAESAWAGNFAKL